jgi:hypothetical protein
MPDAPGRTGVGLGQEGGGELKGRPGEAHQGRGAEDHARPMRAGAHDGRQAFHEGFELGEILLGLDAGEDHEDLQLAQGAPEHGAEGLPEIRFVQALLEVAAQARGDTLHAEGEAALPHRAQVIEDGRIARDHVETLALEPDGAEAFREFFQQRVEILVEIEIETEEVDPFQPHVPLQLEGVPHHGIDGVFAIGLGIETLGAEGTEGRATAADGHGFLPQAFELVNHRARSRHFAQVQGFGVAFACASILPGTREAGHRQQFVEQGVLGKPQTLAFGAHRHQIPDIPQMLSGENPVHGGIAMIEQGGMQGVGPADQDQGKVGAREALRGRQGQSAPLQQGRQVHQLLHDSVAQGDDVEIRRPAFGLRSQEPGHTVAGHDLAVLGRGQIGQVRIDIGKIGERLVQQGMREGLGGIEIGGEPGNEHAQRAIVPARGRQGIPFPAAQP